VARLKSLRHGDERHAEGARFPYTATRDPTHFLRRLRFRQTGNVVGHDDDPEALTQEGAPVFGDTLESPGGLEDEKTKVRPVALEPSSSSSSSPFGSPYDEPTSATTTRPGALEPKTVMARIDELGGDLFFASQPSALVDVSEASSELSDASLQKVSTESVIDDTSDGASFFEGDDAGQNQYPSSDAGDAFATAATLPSIVTSPPPSPPMAPAMRPSPRAAQRFPEDGFDAARDDAARDDAARDDAARDDAARDDAARDEPASPHRQASAWSPHSLPPPPPTSRVFVAGRSERDVGAEQKARLAVFGPLDPALPPAASSAGGRGLSSLDPPLPKPTRAGRVRHRDDDDENDAPASTAAAMAPPVVWTETSPTTVRRTLLGVLVLSAGLLTAVVMGRDRGGFVGGSVDPVVAQTLSERALATIAARVRSDVNPAVSAIARSVGCESVVVVKDSAVDAWMLPNQTVVVSDALLVRLSSDAQLAAVLAHLVAHHRTSSVGGLSPELDGPAVIAAVRAPLGIDEGPVHDAAAALLTAAGYGARATWDAAAALLDSPWAQRHTAPSVAAAVGAPLGRHDEAAYDHEIRERIQSSPR
jgi:hypothetical protein